MAAVAIDTSVLVYAEGIERVPADAEKVAQSRRLMRSLLAARVMTIVPIQALAELHNVLVTKGRLSRSEAARTVREWTQRADIVPTAHEVLAAALDLASDHQMSTFDAIILAAAAQGGCDLLLSEDLQEGFTWRGVAVANPFAVTPGPRVARLLASSP